MRFRIPPQHRETVTVVRKSAYENGEETTVAEDVVCMIQPLTSTFQQRDALRLNSGVGIDQTELTALLSSPNPLIQKRDWVRRSDGSELYVQNILHVKGSPVMRLYLLAQGVS